MVKPIWILLKQETVSGSGISWATCKSAPHSREITTPAPTIQFFTGRMPFLPPNQQRQSTEGNSIDQLIKNIHYAHSSQARLESRDADGRWMVRWVLSKGRYALYSW